MRTRATLAAAAMLAAGALLGWLTAAGQFTTAFAQDKPADGQLDRTVLPIPEPKSAPITELDARNAKAPPRFEVKAPKGAPNVVVVLIDDMGFGQPSTFGGACAMPTLDRLAAGGLRFNNLHARGVSSNGPGNWNKP
jgi:Sulfatase